MKFSKQFLQDEGGRTVIHQIVGHRRWSVVSMRIFEHEGRFYKTVYSEGATESQDERPYEYEGDEIECPEVFPKQHTVIVYEEKP